MVQFRRDDFVSPPPGMFDAEEMARPETTYFQDVWRTFKKRKTAVVSLGILGLMVFMVIFGPMMNEYTYYTNDYSAVNQPPSREHWFGTDTLRSWTRVWVEVAVPIALASTVLPYLIGM